MRRIMHVDMNSFFASCEQANDESLQNKKIAVAGDPSKRHGIILAASYEAKKHGVSTTMPIWKALNVCPDLIIVGCHMELYKDYSARVMEILSEYAPVLEQASIDEAFLDLTGTEMIYKDMVELAKCIQNRIYEDLKLKSSVGISENKLLAKMGSDYKKPMGITELYIKDIKRMLWHMKVSDLYGVGTSTNNLLKSIGILTIEDLAKYDYNTLKIYCGDKRARKLIDSANGLDESLVVANDHSLGKSKGAEATFPEDITSMEILKEQLLSFSEKISYDLRKNEVKAKTIVIKVKYANFTVVTRNYTLNSPTNLPQTIYSEATNLLETSINKNMPIRLIGLTCTNFVRDDEDFSQLNLFNDLEEAKCEENLSKLKKAEEAIDTLRAKYGEGIVIKAKSANAVKKGGG